MIPVSPGRDIRKPGAGVITSPTGRERPAPFARHLRHGLYCRVVIPLLYRAIHGHHPSTWGAHPQSQEYRSGHSPGPAGGDHRPVGLGQVIPGFRYPLRRGPAALRGIPVHLCQAVPVDDGKARYGPHRGTVPGHLHRAEVHLPQPALHRGHHHRDLRLPAPAVCPRGRAALPRPRPQPAGPDRQPDGGRRAGPARGQQADAAGAGSARAQGRAPARLRGAARQRFRARPYQRHRHRPGRCPGTGEKPQAPHRGGGGPLQGARGPGHSAGGILRNRPGPHRRPGHHQLHGWRRRGHQLLGALRLPGVRPQHRRTGAPPVFLQQPRRRLQRLRRPGHEAVFRPGAHRAAPRGQPRRGRHTRLGPAQRLLFPHAQLAGRAFRLRHRYPFRGVGREAPAGHPARQRQAGDGLRLRQRSRRRDQAHPRLRGHHPQHGAPLSRHRLPVGARGTGQVPLHPPLPGLRGHPPAAGRPPRVRGRAQPARHHQHAGGRGGAVFRAVATGRAQGRDRQQDPQGAARPVPLPGGCGPELPDPEPQRRDPVRRRGPAHPPGLPDRRRPGGRDVYPG